MNPFQQNFTRILVFFFGFFYAPLALALDIPPSPDDYVTDRAGFLQPDARAEINQILEGFEKATGNQVVVAIFKSLEGENLEDFSIRLATQWKIGQKNLDNGVILLIFSEDRQMRIEVGYGLEGIITDAVASDIIRNRIAPAFKSGDARKGILSALNAIRGNIDAATRGGGPSTKEKRRSTEIRKMGIREYFFGLLVSCVIFSIGDIIRYFFFKIKRASYTERFGFGEWWLRFSIFSLLWQNSIFYTTRTGRGTGSGGSGFGGFSSGSSGGFSAGGFSGGGGGEFWRGGSERPLVDPLRTKVRSFLGGRVNVYENFQKQNTPLVLFQKREKPDCIGNSGGGTKNIR